jgi:hypothetical protein
MIIGDEGSTLPAVRHAAGDLSRQPARPDSFGRRANHDLCRRCWRAALAVAAVRALSVSPVFLVLLLALATPARAQTCPGPSDPIHDYTTIDNKRDPGVDLYIFCGHQAAIASEVASYRDMHADSAPAADVGDPDYARCRGPAIVAEAYEHLETTPAQMFAWENKACMENRGFVLGLTPLESR